jgi:hypothetical protein
MPRLSIWYIRASFLYLGLGFTLGALLLVNKPAGFAPVLWLLLPSHIEILVIGWMVQLALGAAYWILPRWGRERRSVSLVVASFVILNAGILLIALAFLSNDPGVIRVIGHAAEMGAVAAFAVHAWPRIKPPGAG